MQKIFAAATFVLFGLLVAPPLAVNATVPPAPPVDSVPDEQGNMGPDSQTTLPINPSTATTIPAGCATPLAPQMVFVGDLLSIQDTTATFLVVQIRAGTPSGYVNNSTVDVRYGQDAKFLENGNRYIVGAASDPFSPLLISKVRETAPLFGGDAVVGVNGATGTCPKLEDPVRTILVDGTSIDTGVLDPLMKHKILLALSMLTAVVVVVGGLVVLVMTRQVSRQARRRLGRRASRSTRRG